jgi:hypothetical protein
VWGVERCTPNETSSKRFQFFFFEVYEQRQGHHILIKPEELGVPEAGSQTHRSQVEVLIALIGVLPGRAAAYEEAVKCRPGRIVTLRRKTRSLAESWRRKLVSLSGMELVVENDLNFCRRQVLNFARRAVYSRDQKHVGH